MVLKAKFELALKEQDETKAIAYAKQIISVQRDNFEIVKRLFNLYKKRGLWQDARSLIREYGDDKFRDELQKRDIAVINSALALEAYQQKRSIIALKHANIALKADPAFLPALEIRLKSLIKLGLGFKAAWEIKSLWRENPHLIFAEIFDIINRKYSKAARIKMMKDLAASNPQSALGKLAVGIVAFRIADYALAKEFLNLSSK